MKGVEKMVKGFYSLQTLRKKAKERGYSIKQLRGTDLYILIENESRSESLPIELNEIENIVLDLYKDMKG